MTNYLDATILTIICSVMILLIIALIIMFVLFRKHLSKYINALNSSEETLNVEIVNRNFCYDTLPIAMASCDKDGRMTFINKAMIKMWDILPTDIVMQGKFNLKDSQVLTDNEKIRILSGEDIEITITANLKPGETVKLMGKQITQKIMLICRFSTSYEVHKNISQ